MTTARLLYSLLLYLAAPLLLLRLLWRGRRQRAYLRHIPERFGFYADAGKQRYIWLHAVSVGETRAARSRHSHASVVSKSTLARTTASETVELVVTRPASVSYVATGVRTMESANIGPRISRVRAGCAFPFG